MSAGKPSDRQLLAQALAGLKFDLHPERHQGKVLVQSEKLDQAGQGDNEDTANADCRANALLDYDMWSEMGADNLHAGLAEVWQYMQELIRQQRQKIAQQLADLFCCRVPGVHSIKPDRRFGHATHGS